MGGKVHGHMPTAERLELKCPRAWTVGRADDPPTLMRDDKTFIEAGVGGDRIRLHTGRTGPTALIWSSVPDGRERLVGILTPEDVRTILRAWGDQWQP